MTYEGTHNVKAGEACVLGKRIYKRRIGSNIVSMVATKTSSPVIDKGLE